MVLYSRASAPWVTSSKGWEDVLNGGGRGRVIGTEAGSEVAIVVVFGGVHEVGEKFKSQN